MPSAAAAASASLTLKSSKGAHPTVRLDGFLKSTDTGFQHGEAQTHGDRFVRKMATYGQVRPSVSFTSESRAQREFKEKSAVDVSNLPPQWMDPRGEDKELTFEYPLPPKEINQEYLKLIRNQSLMLPSERLREHKLIKEGEKQWRKDRENTFLYKRRMNKLEREYQQGIVGIDGPMYPGTALYAEPRAFLEAQAERRGRMAEERFEHLSKQAREDDAVAGRNYGQHSCERSRDIPMQRKRVDPNLHPYRFVDTHDRLFPTYVPVWDPERAAVARSHDVRNKQHNIINGAENKMEHRVAPNWEQEQMQQALAQGGRLGCLGGNPLGPHQALPVPGENV